MFYEVVLLLAIHKSILDTLLEQMSRVNWKRIQRTVRKKSHQKYSGLCGKTEIVKLSL